MIHSMTAFARRSQTGKWGTITWEIRSVNHRYLDCSFRLPETLRQLEPKLRESAHKRLHRGRVECFLKYQPGEETTSELSLNMNLVKQLAAATAAISKQFDSSLSPVNPMHVLSWHNVLQISTSNSELVGEKIIKLFEKILKELIATRKKEGSVLKKLLIQKLNALFAEIVKIKELLPAIIAKQRAKILSHLQAIQEKLDPMRLEQEMIFFIQKIDIEEELDRLTTHIKEAFRVLKQDGVMGKRLDFIMQELNREANTLAAKSADKKTTHAAIELKILIEQMREQIQNIE